MSEPLSVLLARPGLELPGECRVVLTDEPDVRVDVLEPDDDPLGIIGRRRPDVVVLEARAGDPAIELCRRIKRDPDFADMWVVVLDASEGRAHSAAVDAGADGVLSAPPDPDELLLQVRAAARLKRLRESSPESRGAPRPPVPASLDQVVSLLTTLLDFGRPGSVYRGRRLAAAALRLARQFEVPRRFLRDLELAAQLHEIGLLAEPTARDPGESGWRYTLVTRTVLDRVDGLRAAAELVEAIYENWDGSGFPGRRQRGQIPLRSRLLRTLIDFYAIVDAGAARGAPTDPQVAAARIAEHAGTWYDPVVVGQLEAMLGGTPEFARPLSRLLLPLEELAEGMVLAEDLCTSSGIKLLARGATLTSGSLNSILRRHASDPVLTGAWVRRS